MDVSAVGCERFLDVSAVGCEHVLDVSAAGRWRESKTAWWSGGETITVGGSMVKRIKIKKDERKTAI